MENKVDCPSCFGEGRWETECCNGAGGCSCRGGMVDMGVCNVCEGRGWIIEGQCNPMANADYLMGSGACFAGSGPRDGYWSNSIALNNPPKN
jgi:hypothetical protein